MILIMLDFTLLIVEVNTVWNIKYKLSYIL